jgi:putative membrane protein
MDLTRVGDLMAMVNAALNTTSALALFAGYRFIRQRSLHAHRRAMVVAVTTSAIFLVFYLTRVALTGTHEIDAEGFHKAIYLSILFSHMGLAVLVVPLVLRLLYLTRRRRFSAHAKLARWTFPIWTYVSVTGIVVYLLLYQVYGYS